MWQSWWRNQLAAAQRAAELIAKLSGSRYRFWQMSRQPLIIVTRSFIPENGQPRITSYYHLKIRKGDIAAGLGGG